MYQRMREKVRQRVETAVGRRVHGAVLLMSKGSFWALVAAGGTTGLVVTQLRTGVVGAALIGAAAVLAISTMATRRYLCRVDDGLLLVGAARLTARPTSAIAVVAPGGVGVKRSALNSTVTVDGQDYLRARAYLAVLDEMLRDAGHGPDTPPGYTPYTG